MVRHFVYITLKDNNEVSTDYIRPPVTEEQLDDRNVSANPPTLQQTKFNAEMARIASSYIGKKTRGAEHSGNYSGNILSSLCADFRTSMDSYTECERRSIMLASFLAAEQNFDQAYKHGATNPIKDATEHAESFFGKRNIDARKMAEDNFSFMKLRPIFELSEEDALQSKRFLSLKHQLKRGQTQFAHSRFIELLKYEAADHIKYASIFLGISAFISMLLWPLWDWIRNPQTEVIHGAFEGTWLYFYLEIFFVTFLLVYPGWLTTFVWEGIMLPLYSIVILHYINPRLLRAGEMDKLLSLQ